MLKKKLLAVLLIIAMVFSFMPAGISVEQTQAADTWRSALYPENWTPGYSINNGTQFVQDFSYAGYERGEKELPTTMSGMTANVLDYGADSTGLEDSTTAIQNAINAVQNAGGGTVYLPTGTYKVKPAGTNAAALKITGSNILFKGDGIGKTYIRCYAENMNYCQVILVQGDASWDTVSGSSATITRDIPIQTTSIPVSSTSGFAVGDYVVVRSNRTQGFIDEHQMGGFWSASVNPTTMGPTFYRQVKAVNASNNTIEIDIPTRYDLKTRDNARIYKVKTPTKTNVGLMDFSIGNKMNPKTNGWGEEDYKTLGTGAYEANQAFLIKFSNSVNCFAKNIATYQAGNSSQIHMTSNGLDLNKTKNVTIENCDFSYPQYEGGGGNGYGINICGQETLIKNCSSTSARHSFAFKYSYANGNVIYHYTSTDPKYGSDFHMYLSMSNLIDNEELNGDFVESVVRPYGGTEGNRHGVTSSQTVFWNTKGNRYKSGANYIIDSRQHGYGYIIGTQGAATNVKTTPTQMSSQYGSPNTAPEDYKEGIGTGATLSPQSLYYDQLQRRLGGNVGQPAPINQIPGTFNATDYSSASTGITSNETNGVKHVGNLSANSALEYKVNATKTGKYRLDIDMVAGNSTPRSLSVYSGDTLLTTLTVPSKDSWFDFTTVSADVNIPNIGEHTLKITTTGSANISDIKFTKLTETIPGTVPVGAYTSKTDAITFTKTGNTLYAGNLNSNSYLDYTVNVAEAGNYKLNLKFAAGDTQWNAKNMLIKLDDQTVATVPVQGSTDWEVFVDHSATFNIASAGQHKLSIVADGGSCNVTDFTAEKVGSSTTEPTTKPDEEIATLPEETITKPAGRVVGYLPDYRLGSLNQIDFSALTHLCLSFMSYSNGGMHVYFSDSDVRNIVDKCHQNGVKVMIAVGGGGGFDTSSKPFSTAAKRTEIINYIMNYVNTYNLDGVDIDIEVTDGELWSHFDEFCSEISGRLKAQNKLYTMAVSSWFTGSIQNSTYNYFDFLNLMTYDENFGNGPVASMNMVNNMLSHYRSKGVSDDRMVIGVPFYGYASGAKAYTYGEILGANANNKWSDTATINGTTVYYNGENTIKQKAEFSKSYGGIMIWELGQDSFGSNSLLKVIKDTVSTGTSIQDPTITAIPGTVPVDSYVTKSSEITINTGATKYAGNLDDGSTLDYYIRVPEKGTYTLTLKLAAGAEQYNAKNMFVKLNNQTVATVPVQGSTDWEVFLDHKTEITFPAKGEYKISLTSDSGACNVTDFIFTKKEEATTQPVVDEKKCDLIVTDIYTDKTYYTGEEAQFVVKIKNIGDAASEGNTKHGLGLNIDGIQVNWCDSFMGPLQPSEEKALVMNSGPNGKSTWTVTAGTHTITATINDTHDVSEATESNNVKEIQMTFIDKPIVSTEMTIKIEGHQINTKFGGYRTLYSVYDPNNQVEEVGLVYGLESYATQDDMVINSKSKYVISNKGTKEIGRMDNFTLENSPNADVYTMTMMFGDVPAAFFSEKIMVRAYAKMKDGSIKYSDVKSKSIFEAADQLYQERLMATKVAHDYLYTNILTKVQSSYQTVDYDWGNTVVKP